MSKIAEGGQSPRDPVEDLVFLYLEEREEGLVKNYEEFARRHTSSGAELRERILALERAGLMGGEEQASFPERLGNFRLIERLGGGGMGVVYVAEEITLGRRVALKLIRPEQVYFGQAKERFRREVEAVAKLSHAGIVQIYSFAEEGGVPFFAMELVEGASLGDVLAQFAGRSPDSLSGADLATAVTARCGIECTKSPLFDGSWVRSCLEIARQIAVALEHAHARGVVHRDIKPSNVMITPDGRARLLDFGLASRVGASRLTRTGAQLGSMPYMPPELVSGRTDEAGPRTDVYSLGATLHESLALSLPFRDESAALLVQRISSGDHESVRRLNPDVSTDAETICNVAMEVDPARRYATAALLASDLANVLERRPIAARRTSRWVHAQRWLQRNPATAAAAILGALVLVGGPLGYGVLQANAAEKQRGLNADLRVANQTVVLTNSSLEAAKGELEKKNSDLANSLLREKAETTRAEKNFKDAMDSIEQMLVIVGAEKLRELPGFGTVRKDLLERALAFYVRLQRDDPGNLAVRSAQVITTSSYGDVLEDLGKTDEALAEYAKAVELSSAVLESDPDSLKAQQMYAYNRMQVARKQQLRGKLELAQSAYQEILPTAEKLALAFPDDPRYVNDLAAVLLNLGGIEMAGGRTEQALKYRLRAAEILRKGTARLPGNFALVSQLVTCLNGLSNCETELGLVEKARADLYDAWTLITGCISAHPDVSDLQLKLMEVAVNYGLSLITRDPEEAERVLGLGFETGKRTVANFPDDLVARNDLASVATNLGYHLSNQSRWSEAEETLDEAVRQGEILVARDGGRVDSHVSLATALGCRSQARLGLGRIEEARADAVRGVEIYARLRRSLPKHPIILAGSTACVMQRADVECKTGDWPTALDTAHEALALGAQRSDISFQAFETLWHIAREAEQDSGLSGEERTHALKGLVGEALDQLEKTIDQGFDDLKRLQTHADYEGLRSDSRFQELVFKLASKAK